MFIFSRHLLRSKIVLQNTIILALSKISVKTQIQRNPSDNQIAITFFLKKSTQNVGLKSIQAHIYAAAPLDASEHARQVACVEPVTHWCQLQVASRLFSGKIV